jgi:flagellar basal body rod protein FlgG
MSVDFTAYVAAALEQPPVADLVYQQNFSFQQVCSVGGTLTSTTKGIATTQGETSGASAGDVALSSTAFSDVKISSTGSSYLRSSNITTQNAWLRYQGQVTVKNIPATGAQVKAELYKISDGNADALSSIARNSSTFSLAHAVGSLGESIPLNGAFKLPEGSDSPSDSYQVRVTIKQNGGTAGTYSLDPGELFLTWQVVSR